MPPINAMQANAGFMPFGAPDLPPLVFPIGATTYPPSPGQVSGMLQQQMYAQQYATPQPSMMMGGTMMQSPFRGGFGGPPSMFGRANMARQAGISSAGTLLGGMESTASLLSLGVGMIPGIGIPLSLGMDAVSSATFGAVGAQRERALALQNQSLGYVVGGNMLSQTGQGMGMHSARMISQGLGSMADSQSFKQMTGGMLNRADLDRLTRIAGESGMLNQAQSPQQVLDTVKKISKQVSTFMSVLEEPDFQRAMQRMGQLHQIGVRLGDMSSVAANARTFARMAGVSADQALGTAVQHATMFQQQGLSAANGITASLGAQGYGRQIASVLDNRTLAMMGGTEGIQNSLMATTASTFSNPLLMASALSRGADGRLHANSADLMRVLSGPNASYSDISRRGSSNLRGLGGRRAISEVLANTNRLRDEAMDGLSGDQMMLANIRMGQLRQHQAGGSLEENMLAVTGGDENATRALMTLLRDPRAMAAIQEQGRISARDRAVGTRDRQLENQSRWMQRAWDTNVANPLGHSFGGMTAYIGRWAATNQERTESLALQGNGRGRALDGDNFATDVFTASVRDEIGAIGRGERAGRGGGLTAEVRRRVAQENRMNADSWYGALGGATGGGFTAAQRGGDSLRQTVLDAGSFQQRVGDSIFTLGGRLGGDHASVERIQRMADSQIALADTIQRGTGTAAERYATRNNALNALGESNRGSASRALNIATEAAKQYFGSREGLFGSQGSRDENGMVAAARRSMLAGNMSERDVSALLASGAFRSAITMNAQQTGNEEVQRQIAASVTQGRTVDANMRGQSSAALRSIVSEERGKLRDVLGLSGGAFGMGQANDADVGRVSDMLTSTGNQSDDAMRRKLFTAYAMSKSSDPATARRGSDEFSRLQAERGPDVTEMADAVKRQIDGMDPSAAEDLGNSYSGKTVEQAAAQTATAAAHLDRAKEATARVALSDVLGEAGAGAYGDSQNIDRLRSNADHVTNRRIKRMLQDPTSSSDAIRQAIQEEASGRAGEASRSGSVGAGEEASGTEDATDSMISDIQAGLENFPEATQNLSSAATALREASTALRDAMESGGISASLARAG